MTFEIFEEKILSWKLINFNHVEVDFRSNVYEVYVSACENKSKGRLLVFTSKEEFNAIEMKNKCQSWLKKIKAKKRKLEG